MPDPEPLARRVFRHRETGHPVSLLVRHAPAAGGPRELLWQVWLEDTPGSPPAVARLRFMSMHDTRDAARRAFTERQRALRVAGYERVGDALGSSGRSPVGTIATAVTERQASVPIGGCNRPRGAAKPSILGRAG